MSSDVTQISAGEAHSCAIKAGGAYCWGSGLYYGQLGQGWLAVQNTPVAVSNMSSDVTQISAGSFLTCAIKSGGAYCWGANYSGGVGDATNTDRYAPVLVQGMSADVTSINAGATNSACAVKSGLGYCWGTNAYATLGDGNLRDRNYPALVSGMNTGVSRISVGVRQACAIKLGVAYCWGQNFYGELGNETWTDSRLPVLVH